MARPSKSELRKACWQALRDAGAARFPGVVVVTPDRTIRCKRAL